MSILRDFLDMKDDVSKDFKWNQRGSVSKEANSGVLQFPCYVSAASSLEHTTTISKALEREYTSFVTIMTSMESVTDEKSIKSYIQKIHQNTNDGMNILIGDDWNPFSYRDIEFLNKSPLLEGSSKAAENLISEKCCKKEAGEIVTAYNDLDEGCKKKAKKILAKIKKEEGCKVYQPASDEQCLNIKNESDNSFSQIFFVTDLNENLSVYRADLVLDEDNYDESKFITRTLSENKNSLQEYNSGLNTTILNNMYKPKGYAMFGNNPFVKGSKISEEDIVTATARPGEFKQYTSISDEPTDRNVMKDILRDNDVKKANELAPTLLHLKTYFKDEDDALHAVDYMIGIKTVVHKISSQSMCDNIVKAAKRGKGFLNLVKLTTGEISFFKDFLFAIPRIKDDVKAKWGKDSWANALIRRKKYSKVLSAINASQQLVPNTTLVITMDEAIKIKSEHNIDVMNFKTIKDIMDKLFLLGFVVIDSATEVAYFLFDGRNDYEEYSFNSLEKENSNSAKEVKNIMQVLGRM